MSIHDSTHNSIHDSNHDNVLLEHGGLPHVLSLAVHLVFCAEQVEGVILCNFYSLSFLVRGLLYA